MEIRPFHAFRTWKVHVVIFSFHATHFHTLLTTLHFRYVNARFRQPLYHATHFQILLATLHFRYVNARFDFRCVELSANHGTVRKVRNLVVFVYWLAPKYILLLLTHFRETHSMAIVTTFLTRSSHKNVSLKKIENGFSIWIDHFPCCSWRTNFENTLVLESLAAWRNLAATRIFLSPSLM